MCFWYDKAWCTVPNYKNALKWPRNSLFSLLHHLLYQAGPLSTKSCVLFGRIWILLVLTIRHFNYIHDLLTLVEQQYCLFLF